MKKITLILCSLFVLLNIFAQQDVYSRDDSGTGSWWHGNNPWYYSTWANNQNRPDNNSGTRNYVKIGHNNNTTMEVNGA